MFVLSFVPLLLSQPVAHGLPPILVYLCFLACCTHWRFVYFLRAIPWFWYFAPSACPCVLYAVRWFKMYAMLRVHWWCLYLSSFMLSILVIPVFYDVCCRLPLQSSPLFRFSCFAVSDPLFSYHGCYSRFVWCIVFRSISIVARLRSVFLIGTLI